MFKVTSQLTNVRPSKTENPELATATSDGMVKINAPGAKLMGLTVKDYVTVVEAEKENGEAGLFLVKGNASNPAEKVAQVGSILSSSSGTQGGTLQFGSGNAWKSLGGNKEHRRVFDISSTPIESEGKNYFEINFVRTEEKLARAKKGEGKAKKATGNADNTQAAV